MSGWMLNTCCAIITFIMLPSHAHAQKIYSATYASRSDVLVYVVPYESHADLNVYKAPYGALIGHNEGIWYFTTNSSQADKKIFFTAYESRADLKIFFVSSKSKAGWRDVSKKHLMY